MNWEASETVEQESDKFKRESSKLSASLRLFLGYVFPSRIKRKS